MTTTAAARAESLTISPLACLRVLKAVALRIGAIGEGSNALVPGRYYVLYLIQNGDLLATDELQATRQALTVLARTGYPDPWHPFAAGYQAQQYRDFDLLCQRALDRLPEPLEPVAAPRTFRSR